VDDPPPLEVDPDLPPLEAGLARLAAANAWLCGVVEVKDAELAAARSALESAQQQLAMLGERVADLERRLARDSSTSSKPPSSDSPYAKKPRDRSLRSRSGRRPGRQPGAPSSALRQSASPDETVVCAPDSCAGCGAGLAGAPLAGMHRRQVFEAPPPPPPRVIEYQVQAKACVRCGAVTAGQPPAGVTGRAQYGPRAHAVAAHLASAHHVPITRAAQLMGDLTGLRVSAGWMAGARHKAAARLDPFMTHVRGLLRQAGVLYADETPARAAGGLHYLHVACTGHLTALHAAGRSAAGIDAGGVLPGYAGTIVRDGYAGYDHLTAALHAWCGAHNLRDLRDLYTADPAGQTWARAMADVLITANTAANSARAARQPHLPSGQLTRIVSGYHQAVTAGLHTNAGRRSQTARDGLRLARRFARHQDMILRFATDLTVGFTSNQAERDIRPVKVQQRTSGGCWRTLDGLADFAIVQSYLSTAAKWGITKLDALTQLFTTGPWLPPATAPP
jgi:transposase